MTYLTCTTPVQCRLVPLVISSSNIQRVSLNLCRNFYDGSWWHSRFSASLNETFRIPLNCFWFLSYWCISFRDPFECFCFMRYWCISFQVPFKCFWFLRYYPFLNIISSSNQFSHLWDINSLLHEFSQFHSIVTDFWDINSLLYEFWSKIQLFSLFRSINICCMNTLLNHLRLKCPLWNWCILCSWLSACFSYNKRWNE